MSQQQKNLTPVGPEAPAVEDVSATTEAPVPARGERPQQRSVQQSASRLSRPVKVESYRDPKYATELPNGLTIFNYIPESA